MFQERISHNKTYICIKYKGRKTKTYVLICYIYVRILWPLIFILHNLYNIYLNILHKYHNNKLKAQTEICKLK